MKNKKLLVLILFVISFNSAFSQLKVNQHGGIGMGIEPRTDYKLMMKGNLMLTTYPEIPAPLTRFTEFRIKVGNGDPGCEFGTPTRKIAVWSSEVGYNNLYAAHYYTGSDSSIKTDIEPITDALEKIMELNSYSYKLKFDTIIDDKTTIGFIAQEIYEILPDITDSAKGILTIDYQQIIPLLVQAFKEQQYEIDLLTNGAPQQRISDPNNYEQHTLDSLTYEISNIKKQLDFCCGSEQSQSSKIYDKAQIGSVLFQNKPNPFSEKTMIEFEIVEHFHSASIMVFDLHGNFKLKLPIIQNGKGQIIINGFQLSAGMYLYSLIVDDKEIDTKRMILMK